VERTNLAMTKDSNQDKPAAEDILDDTDVLDPAAVDDTSPADVEEAPAPPPEPKTPEQEAAEWKDIALRRQADLENFRKRVERERIDSIRFANAGLLEDLLPILDNFNMGLDAARAESEDSMIFKGMEMVKKQIADFLDGRGVTEVPVTGAFDPATHDAVGQEPSDEVAEGEILRVMRKGYVLNDRLLRAATVIVSQGAGGADEHASTEDF